MVTDEQRAELRRKCEELEARQLEYSETSEEYRALGELREYIEEETRG